MERQKRKRESNQTEITDFFKKQPGKYRKKDRTI